MSIKFSVLGAPGKDNALLVTVNTGEHESTILFDCGEDTVSRMSVSARKNIDAVFFSHFHIDHIAGFDSWFRTVFDRTDKPSSLFGPSGSIQILGNRLRSFLWNLHEESSASVEITELSPVSSISKVLRLGNKFEEPDLFTLNENAVIAPSKGAYTITPVFLNHGTISVGYIIQENEQYNINAENLKVLGLQPGQWLQVIKDTGNNQQEITLSGKKYNVANLRRTLLKRKQGDSLAYLTDFGVDAQGLGELIKSLKGCKTIVCESQYAMADAALAGRHHHLTTLQAAMIAYRAGAERLYLMHVSSRYSSEQYPEMLAEAREIFQHTYFPVEWNIEE